MGFSLTVLTGPSPPSELRDRLFDRFRKAQENAPGSGLGLSIVRQVIVNAGGRVRFMDTNKTCVEIILEAAPA